MKGLIFTYAMTYGGSVVALFNPFYGLLIYICFAIIKPDALWHWSVPVGNYSRIIAIAFLVGWAIHGFGTVSIRRARPILYCFLGYWVWVAISTANSPNPELGWPFVVYLGKIVLPFIAGLTLIHSVEKLKQLAIVILASTAYLAFEANLSYFQGPNIVLTGKFIGIDNNSVSILIVTGAGLAFFFGLYAQKAWMRWGAFACAGLMAHVPMFAMSRGGMLALIVVGAATFVLIPKQPRHYWLFGLAVAVGLMLAGPSVREEFVTVFADEESRDYSAQSRIDLWRACTQEMLANPVFGLGQEHFPLAAKKYGWPGGTKEAHSLWFQTGAELGFPGLGFLLAFYGMTLYSMWQLARQEEVWTDPWFPFVGRMVIASLLGYMAAASFVTTEGYELPYYVALLGAASWNIAPSFALEPELEESTSTDEDWQAVGLEGSFAH